MNRAYLATAVMIGGMLAVTAGCSKPEVLQVNFPEGFERTYEIQESSETEMSIPVINEGMRQAERTNSVLKYSVAESATEGPATVRVLIQEAGGNTSMSFMGESMEFDAEDEDGPLAGFVDAVVGEEYSIVVEPDGNIVSFDGVDAIFDKVLESQGVGALSREEFRAYMTEMWSVEQERLSSQKCVFPRLPVTSVDPGATWTLQYEVTYPVPMSIEDTYTVLNVYEDRVTLDVTSVLSPHPTESSIEFGAQFSMNLEVNGDGEGFMEVDRATGWINEASTTLRIRANAEMVGMPVPLPGGQNTIPLTTRFELSSKAI